MAALVDEGMGVGSGRRRGGSSLARGLGRVGWAGVALVLVLLPTPVGAQGAALVAAQRAAALFIGRPVEPLWAGFADSVPAAEFILRWGSKIGVWILRSGWEGEPGGPPVVSNRPSLAGEPQRVEDDSESDRTVSDASFSVPLLSTLQSIFNGVLLIFAVLALHWALRK